MTTPVKPAAHTPGPWHAEPMRGRGDRHADWVALIDQADGRCVCRIEQASAVGEERAQANIDLIVRSVNVTTIADHPDKPRWYACEDDLQRLESAPKLAEALRQIKDAPSGMSADWYERIARDALAEWDAS